MESNVRFIKKNICYRIVIRNWHSYILDVEKNIIPIFFPYLFWLLKQNMYAISTETMRELNVKNLYTNQNQPFRGSHITMVGLTYAVTPIFDYTVDLTKIQSIIFLIILGSIFIGFRLYYHRYSHNQFVKNDLDLKQLQPIKVKIKPKDAKQYFIQLFMPLFFDLSILISIIFYIEERSLGALIMFILFVPVRLFIFTLFFANPAIEETSNYQITLMDENDKETFE